MMTSDQMKATKPWLIIFYIIILVLLLRYFPKAGYGLAIITLLVILLHNKQKKTQ